VGYTFYPFLHPGPVTAAQGTGANKITFQASPLPTVMDGLVSHLAYLLLEIDGIIDCDTGSPAVSNYDFDRLLCQWNGAALLEGQGVQLIANGEQPVQCSYLAIRRIMDSFDFNGNSPVLNSGLTANSGAGRSSTVKLTYLIPFMPERDEDRYLYLNPVQWWSTGTFNFYIEDPSVALGSTFSWHAAPTVKLTCGLMMSPDIHSAPPFEWRDKVNPTTSGTTTILDPGIYSILGFESPAISTTSNSVASMNSIATVVSQLYSPENVNRFPNTMSGRDYAAYQSGRGFGSNNYYSVFAVASSSNSSTIPPCDAAAINLVGPAGRGPHESIANNEYQIAKNFNLVTVLNSNLTGCHHYYFARSLNRQACSVDKLGGPVGESVKKSVSDQLGSQCGGGFGQFVPFIPAGKSAPPSGRINRAPLVARRG